MMNEKCQIGSLLEVPDLSEISHLTPKTVNQTALRFTLYPLSGPSWLFFSCMHCQACLQCGNCLSEKN